MGLWGNGEWGYGIRGRGAVLPRQIQQAGRDFSVWKKRIGDPQPHALFRGEDIKTDYYVPLYFFFFPVAVLLVEAALERTQRKPM